MNNFFNAKEIINELEKKLFTVLYSRNLEFSIVRLVFLKYAVDNYVGATSVENMQKCARAQKMFAMKDIENGVETIFTVLKYIDDEYNLSDVLSGNETISEYARELFGEDKNRQRKNVVTTDFKGVMDILGSLDLEEKNDNNVLGKALVEALIENIAVNSNRNSFSSEYTTRSSLSKLAGQILNVKPEDVFCDFASGVGLSTIEITQNAMPRIVNADLNNASVAISVMLYIMYGYRNFKIFNENCLVKRIDGLCGNKVFVDGPIASKLEKTQDNEYTDSSLAIINKVMHDYLSDDEKSLAVITLPSSPLFVTKKQAVALRKEMLTKGMLKAVVALPPMWRGTAVGTNILVISREKNKDILFVNAQETQATARERVADVTGEVLLPQDRINLIAQTVLNPETIEGFSKVVSYEEVQNKEYSLIPASYVDVFKEEDDVTLEEIDNQLAKLYSQLLD